MSYRGSSNLRNWLEDFFFFKRPYTVTGCDNCEVHGGFLAAHNSLKNEAFAYLDVLTAKYPGARVVVTGHSLGGAIATLAAVDVQLAGYETYQFTYGSPRVGDYNFAAFHDLLIETNYRAVYRNDPVPTVPFEEVLTFYHVGTEIHFYDCVNSYIAYPQFGDDSPLITYGNGDDHFGYFCLQITDTPTQII